ncbi:SDR family NAD(P)-dependent oxidoreductase, partial [bacterium]
MGRPTRSADREALGEEVKIVDQVAIVTGSGSGLGRAMALALAREETKILIAEVREDEGKKVLKEIEALGS